MTILNSAQIYALALQSGFGLIPARTITSIALAESGGDTNAINPRDPYGGSFGLLQINGAHFLSGATTKQCAFDPLCSMKFAYQLSKQGKDFRPWGTYTSGKYLQQVQSLDQIPTQIANQSQQQSTGSTSYPWNNALSPLKAGASVGDVLIYIDELFQLFNPFDLSYEAPIATPGSPVQQAEQLPIVGSIYHVFVNIGQDMSAILLRLVLMIVGVVFIIKSPTLVGNTIRTVGGGAGKGLTKIVELGAL